MCFFLLFLVWLIFIFFGVVFCFLNVFGFKIFIVGEDWFVEEVEFCVLDCELEIVRSGGGVFVGVDVVEFGELIDCDCFLGWIFCGMYRDGVLLEIVFVGLYGIDIGRMLGFIGGIFEMDFIS